MAAGLLDLSDPLHGLGQGIIALGLCMARWLGVTLIMPVFSRTGLTGLVRGGFAFAMALPLLPVGMGVVAGLDRAEVFITIVLLSAKEWLVGMALGLILGVPVWAAEAAGEFLDVQRGTAAQGGQADPQGMNQAGVIGTFFAIVSVALLLMAGGVDIIAGAVHDSYRLWPLGEVAPRLGPGSADVFAALLDKILSIALAIAAPLAIVTVASDILLGYVSRLAPSLNSYSMGAALKSLIIAALLPLYSRFLLGDLVTVTQGLKGAVQALEAASK